MNHQRWRDLPLGSLRSATARTTAVIIHSISNIVDKRQAIGTENANAMTMQSSIFCHIVSTLDRISNSFIIIIETYNTNVVQFIVFFEKNNAKIRYLISSFAHFYRKIKELLKNN
jgi:hypothetical protein